MLFSNTWNPLIMFKQMISIKLDKNAWYIEILMLYSNTWNHLTVGKQMIGIRLYWNT